MEVIMLDIKVMSDKELESITGGLTMGLILPNGKAVSPDNNQGINAFDKLYPLIVDGTIDTPLTPFVR